MCGIAGLYNYSDRGYGVQSTSLYSMLDCLHHRGPDERGVFISRNIGIAQSRLSIIDIVGGRQPISNETSSIQVVFNGEIFNYIELRNELMKCGHRFKTNTDTEVIVHAYAQYGKEFVDRLNGQFAIALWDERLQKLLLFRDRLGICPIYYSILDGSTLIFASEIKALFGHGRLKPEIDPDGIGQIFTYWVCIPPATAFKNVNELPPGCLLEADGNGIQIRPYWQIKFPDAGEHEEHPVEWYSSQIRELLYDASQLRLRADVPVAAYLSGGIDSSIVSHIIRSNFNNDLKTFSVGFTEDAFDERTYQRIMAGYINSEHRFFEVDNESIAQNFSRVIWHSEKPMTRTAPVPLFSLSKMVHDSGLKVVLTGEGADEIFGGYNIFKENKIRHFWARQPSSSKRPKLLSRLYPYVRNNRRIAAAFWQKFFAYRLEDTGNPYYSHLIRWHNTSYIKQFMRDDFFDRRNVGKSEEHLEEYLDRDLMRWDPFNRSQYLEIKLFLPGYLLSSQGDRMLMAHSVEGRFPFLDHRLVEFAARIPPRYKMYGLQEKYILKKSYENELPREIVYRTKQPYRAPIHKVFANYKRHAELEYVLSEQKLNEYGCFETDMVYRLLSKLKRAGGNLSEREEMALTGIVSLQLLYYHFIENNY